MTISASFSYSPSCDSILRQAMQIAGILGLGRTPSAPELTDGRDFMNTFLKAARAAALTQMEEVESTLVAGTGSYTLAADTIEVSFPIKLLAPGETGENVVIHWPREVYAEQTDHTTQGLPYAAYVEKTSSVVVKFHPIPDKAYTFRYQRQRLIRDMASGSDTLDKTQRWFESLIYAMAHKYALTGNINMPKVKYLFDMATSLEAQASGRENEGGGLQFELPVSY